MLGAGGDKDEVVEEDEVQDAHAPTEEGKTSTVPFQQHPRGGAHSAGDMQTRKSMDSLPVKRSSSVSMYYFIFFCLCSFD